MDSIDYYNRHAAEFYDRTVELDLKEELERFILLLPEGAAVLDLGCGSGRDSLYMKEEGLDVTAMDASEELCELAQIHIGQDVLLMRFEEIDFMEVFDGVWANASLLHVPSEEMDEVLDKIIKSMKTEGILYMSFKYGDFSGIRDGRYFKDYNTRELKELLGRHPSLELIEIYKNEDVREEKKMDRWIHVLARKLDLHE